MKEYLLSSEVLSTTTVSFFVNFLTGAKTGGVCFILGMIISLTGGVAFGVAVAALVAFFNCICDWSSFTPWDQPAAIDTLPAEELLLPSKSSSSSYRDIANTV